MFASLLKKVAEALDKYQIDYLVIGGQALLLYGEPRLTKDIDITLGSEYERQAMARATLALMQGYPVKFASKEDLIIHKIIAGRPRDIEDVKSVLRRQSIDEAYVRPWLKEFARGLDQDFDQVFARIYEEVQSESDE